MNHVGIIVTGLLLTVGATVVDNAGYQKRSNGPARASETSAPPNSKPLTGRQANAVIRDAIFGDRRQLLSYLSDPRWRQVVCTPALKETYELFQSSLQQELDVLWDLDLDTSERGISKKEHDDVKACIAEMEKYDDNFKAWEELNEAQENQKKQSK